MAKNKRAAKIRSEGSGRRYFVLFVVAVIGALVAYAMPFLAHTRDARAATSVSGLVDQNGASVNDGALREHYKLVFFGFTQCASVCPATLLKVHVILNDLEPTRASLAPLFVSVDPDHDSPAVLKRYTAAFDSRIVGITGDSHRIDRLVEAYGALAVRHVGAAGPNSVDHSARMYLMAPDDSLITYYEFDEPVQDIAADIKRRVRG